MARNIKKKILSSYITPEMISGYINWTAVSSLVQKQFLCAQTLRKIKH